MPEKDKIFDSAVKFEGVFSFKDFYKFCYEWLMEETGIGDFQEEKYDEKLKGDSKEIRVEWVGKKKLTDYFLMEISVKFELITLKEVEVVQDGKKIKTNKGDIKVKVKGFLVKDYGAKFERTACKKFLRSTYEKYIIPSRVSQFEDKVYGDAEEFLGQAKSYLALEGKK